jgi:hypothetical protein
MTVKKIIIVGSIIVLLELIGGYLYLKYSHDKKPYQASEFQVQNPAATSSPYPVSEDRTAEIALDTQANNLKRGDNFSVNIILDTFSSPTAASDVTIKFDPQFLSSTKPNEPFTESKLFQKTVFNKLDAKNGIATISAIADFDKPFVGRGVLSTMTFRTLKAGDTEIKVEYTPEETRDSNIVSDTQDILESVKNLPISIK